ncbi:hypothetical protein XENOCAPTIV_020090 [Xenoophorus captivus]|uniref:Uncharacterized protein n=1 Tax=Xenoophorus captivus TaxID=1517983 RepID=A0ABV0RE66_9TELE
MAMSSDPGCEMLDPNSPKQTSSLTDIMAAMTTKDPEGSSANGMKNSKTQQDDRQGKRVQVMRPHLSGRKLSLQERGTYLSAGSEVAYTHISPRGARRPTVESKRVSISDSQELYQRNQLTAMLYNDWLDKLLYVISPSCSPEPDRPSLVPADVGD